MKKRKVKMGMTDLDLRNAKYLETVFELPNKASSISVALKYTADMYRMLAATGSTLRVHHQDGSTEILSFEKS